MTCGIIGLGVEIVLGKGLEFKNASRSRDSIDIISSKNRFEAKGQY
jgi:hypothetical protein